MTTVGVFAAVFDGEGRILCVKQEYGYRRWALPGGRLEPGESVDDALRREVREETGYLVERRRLIGVYVNTATDDLVVFVEATIAGRERWEPDGEIGQVAFFPREALPQPMSPRHLKRIDDAFEGTSGVVHAFGPDTPL